MHSYDDVHQKVLHEAFRYSKWYNHADQIIVTRLPPHDEDVHMCRVLVPRTQVCTVRFASNSRLPDQWLYVHSMCIFTCMSYETQVFPSRWSSRQTIERPCFDSFVARLLNFTKNFALNADDERCRGGATCDRSFISLNVQGKIAGTGNRAIKIYVTLHFDDCRPCVDVQRSTWLVTSTDVKLQIASQLPRMRGTHQSSIVVIYEESTQHLQQWPLISDQSYGKLECFAYVLVRPVHRITTMIPGCIPEQRTVLMYIRVHVRI